MRNSDQSQRLYSFLGAGPDKCGFYSRLSRPSCCLADFQTCPLLLKHPLMMNLTPMNLNWRYWCPCQIDMKNAPVELVRNLNGSNDGIARITVNDASLGGNACRYKSECPSPANSLLADYGRPKAWKRSHKSKLSGENLFRPSDKKLLKNPYCTEEVMRRAIAAGQEDLCIQRQELRLQNRTGMKPTSLISIPCGSACLRTSKTERIRYAGLSPNGSRSL